MIIKIVLHSPSKTARLHYNEEGELLSGDKDFAKEVARHATRLEVVAGQDFVILNEKNEVLAGDERALHDALADFPDSDVAEFFKTVAEKDDGADDGADDDAETPTPIESAKTEAIKAEDLL